MSLKYQIKETAPFVEFTALSKDSAASNPFDIIITTEINLNTYCQALISKAFQLQQSQLESFINHQCSLVKEPQKWLNKFEKLLSLNEDLFENNKNRTRLSKLQTLIELQRKHLQSSSIKDVKHKTPQRLINAASEERHFSFFEVKNYLETIKEFHDKIFYLTEEVFEYKQADIISKNSKLLDYDTQCNQLIEKLQTMRKMRIEFEKEQKELMQQNTQQVPKKNKIRINGSTNILVNAFKQMMLKKGSNGKPYLDYSIKEIAELICDNFIDEFSEPLSKATVQTYLSPNRIDKDPNNDDKIKL